MSEYFTFSVLPLSDNYADFSTLLALPIKLSTQAQLYLPAKNLSTLSGVTLPFWVIIV
jgi:hypothetical protein